MGIWRVWNRAVTASRTAAGLKATVEESEKQSEAENEFLAISAQAFSKGYTVQGILEVFSAEAAQHPDLYSEDYQEIFNQWLRLARLKWDLQAVRRSREKGSGEPDAKRPRSAPASPTGWLCCGEMRDFACMSCPACGQTQTNEPASQTDTRALSQVPESRPLQAEASIGVQQREQLRRFGKPIGKVPLCTLFNPLLRTHTCQGRTSGF